jgi:hypothetical protein
MKFNKEQVEHAAEWLDKRGHARAAEEFRETYGSAIHDMVANYRGGHSGLNLGQLLDALEKCDQSLPCVFNSGGSPGGYDSYRGYYEQLALSTTHERQTVAQVLAKLRPADGDICGGYKGGDYRMTRDTLVWVDEYGECKGIAVVDVSQGPINVMIVTQKTE